MNWLAVEKARELHKRHPEMSIPVDIETLVVAEGCELIDWPFLSPVKEVKQGRWIGIAQGLDLKEKRYLIAHALGHHLLHCGNQLSFDQHWQMVRQRQERAAEVCAAHILIPEAELAKVITRPIWEISEYFQVPEDLVYQRINEFATPEEMKDWEGSCDNDSSA